MGHICGYTNTTALCIRLHAILITIIIVIGIKDDIGEDYQGDSDEDDFESWTDRNKHIHASPLTVPLETLQSNSGRKNIDIKDIDGGREDGNQGRNAHISPLRLTIDNSSDSDESDIAAVEALQAPTSAVNGLSTARANNKQLRINLLADDDDSDSDDDEDNDEEHPYAIHLDSESDGSDDLNDSDDEYNASIHSKSSDSTNRSDDTETTYSGNDDEKLKIRRPRRRHKHHRSNKRGKGSGKRGRDKHDQDAVDIDLKAEKEAGLDYGGDGFNSLHKHKVDSLLKQCLHLTGSVYRSRKRAHYFDVASLFEAAVPLHEYTKMFSLFRSYIKSRLHDYMLMASRLLLMLLAVTLFYYTIYPNNYYCERKVNSGYSLTDNSYLDVNQTRRDKCMEDQPLLIYHFYSESPTSCQWNADNESCTRRPPPDTAIYYLLASLFVTLCSSVPDQILQYLLKIAYKRPRLEDIGLSSQRWLGKIRGVVPSSKASYATASTTIGSMMVELACQTVLLPSHNRPEQGSEDDDEKLELEELDANEQKVIDMVRLSLSLSLSLYIYIYIYL